MATLFHFKKGNDKFKLLCFILLAASFLYYGFQKSKAGAFQFDDLQVLIMGSKAGFQNKSTMNTSSLIAQHVSILKASLYSAGYYNEREECIQMVKVIRHRLDYLQNPQDCLNAKMVLCDSRKAGMGSTLHHWVYCLIYAYSLNRTLILDLHNWSYLKNLISPDGVRRYKDLFQPISKCQLSIRDRKSAVVWSKALDGNESTIKAPRIITIPSPGILSEQFHTLPSISHYTMPTDLFYKAVQFKYNPMAWWIGILAQYIIRPSHHVKQFISQSKIDLGFQSPIVGVHIRRTDKKFEAKMFQVSQYMKKVDEFYNQLAKNQLNVKVRRVFIATDDPKLIKILKQAYTNYTFIHPPISQLTAGTYTSRYSAVHLKYFLRDIYLLAECDYLVVTMSSNVGSLAYELHEVLHHTTRNQHYISLDDNYHIFGLTANNNSFIILQAIKHCPSKMPNDIDLRIGDLLDNCKIVSKSNKTYYGYSFRLKKYGNFHQTCVKYLIDYHNFLNYTDVDMTLAYNNTHSLDDACLKTSIADQLL